MTDMFRLQSLPSPTVELPDRDDCCHRRCHYVSLRDTAITASGPWCCCHHLSTVMPLWPPVRLWRFCHHLSDRDATVTVCRTVTLLSPSVRPWHCTVTVCQTVTLLWRFVELWHSVTVCRTVAWPERDMTPLSPDLCPSSPAVVNPARHTPGAATLTPDTWAEKFEIFQRINSVCETNGSFDSCNSCKRLVPSRLHELHDSKLPFVSRIESIRSKLSIFSAHVSGITFSS